MGVWTEIDLEEKSSVRPSILMGSRDVYDPPLGQLALKLPQGTMSGALTRNMLENRLCVTCDTDTSRIWEHKAILKQIPNGNFHGV